MSGRPKADPAVCAELYQNGWPLAEIKRELRIGDATLHRYLTRTGVSRSRKPGPKPALTVDMPNRFRRYYLPHQIRTTRAKLEALEAEARRYGMDYLVEARP